MIALIVTPNMYSASDLTPLITTLALIFGCSFRVENNFPEIWPEYGTDKGDLGKASAESEAQAVGLLDQVREVRRRRHCSLRTEEAYVGWVRAAAKKNFQQPSLCGSADLPIGSLRRK